MSFDEIFIGLRVQCILSFGDPDLRGFAGTVVTIKGRSVGVRFDQFNEGHDFRSEHSLLFNNGWWCSASELMSLHILPKDGLDNWI